MLGHYLKIGESVESGYEIFRSNYTEDFFYDHFILSKKKKKNFSNFISIKLN